MRISVPQLEGEIIELLEDMKYGATLWFSSKLSGQYHLELPEGQSVKIVRKVARTAWERGWINADQHKGGLTHYVLTAEGRIHCWRDAIEPNGSDERSERNRSVRLALLNRTTL
jgi:hypothetical protein